MSMHIDVDGVAGEVRKLRGGLSELAEAVQKSLWRTEAQVARNAEQAGSRYWAIARRDAGRALEAVEDNALISATAVIALAALAGLYFVLRGTLESRRVARRPATIRRGRGASAAAAGPAHPAKKSPRLTRSRKPRT